MAIGALQAIQAAGRTVNKDIYLVGVDALDAALNEVANGNMTGTVLNDAKGQATQAVASMEELLGGKTFEADHQSVYVDYVKVTPDNVKDFQEFKKSHSLNQNNRGACAQAHAPFFREKVTKD